MIRDENWIEMMSSELKDLHRMLDRKASSSDVDQYKSIWQKKGKIAIRSPLEDSRELQGYHFGNDIKADIKIIFQLFCGAARMKLEQTVLGEYASSAYVDSLFQQLSTSFSSTVAESNSIYFQQIDSKITAYQKRIDDFKLICEDRLSSIESSIVRLRLLLHSLRVGKCFTASKKHSPQQGVSISRLTSRQARMSDGETLSTLRFGIKVAEDAKIESSRLASQRKSSIRAQKL